MDDKQIVAERLGRIDERVGMMQISQEKIERRFDGFEASLKEIGITLVKIANFEERLKAVESKANQSEDKLAKLETSIWLLGGLLSFFIPVLMFVIDHWSDWVK